MNIDPIAAEIITTYSETYQHIKYPSKLNPLIKAAIEKATDEVENKWQERMKKFGIVLDKFGWERAAQASDVEWSEDYDLTSFLHGDKTTVEQLRDANDNLFKIARKYCLENKQIMAAERKEQARLIWERDGLAEQNEAYRLDNLRLRDELAAIRAAQAGEPCPNCGRPLSECHGNCIFNEAHKIKAEDTVS